MHILTFALKKRRRKIPLLPLASESAGTRQLTFGGYILTQTYLQRADGLFILTWRKHFGHCGSMSNIFQTTAPVAFFRASSESPRLGRPSNQAPASPPPPHFLLTTVSAYDLAPLHYSAPSTSSSDSHGAPLSSACGGWRRLFLVRNRKRCFLLGAPAASGVTHYYMRGGTCDLFNYSALHFYPTIPNATREIDCLKDPSL